jgi:uncharacterized membrane protein YfhO
VRDDPEHVTGEARSDHTSVVVLTDPIAPGWRATVNGRPAPALAANQLGRAVVVPAGENRVDFVYHAPLLPAGIAVAVIGWTIVAIGAVVRARR